MRALYTINCKLHYRLSIKLPIILNALAVVLRLNLLLLVRVFTAANASPPAIVPATVAFIMLCVSLLNVFISFFESLRTYFLQNIEIYSALSAGSNSKHFRERNVIAAQYAGFMLF